MRSLTIADRCIPWNPVPTHANRWFALGVAQLEVTTLSNMDAATALVFSPNYERQGLNAWRISFEHVMAVRYGPIRNWHGSLHAPRPEDIDVGAWEVQPSSWLAQITPVGFLVPPHHYVITYDGAIYEIAAGSWRSEALPGDWEQIEDIRRDASQRTDR